MNSPHYTLRQSLQDGTEGFMDTIGGEIHDLGEDYGHEGEKELASSSVSIYTSSLSPLAHYNAGDQQNAPTSPRPFKQGTHTRSGSFSSDPRGVPGATATAKSQREGTSTRFMGRQASQESIGSFDIVDDDAGMAPPRDAQGASGFALDVPPHGATTASTQYGYRSTRYGADAQQLETEVLRRQVEELRQDNARYRHYEEQLCRAREQLEVKSDLLARTGRRAERAMAEMEEEVRACRAREDRALREAESLRHELERTMCKLQLAEELVREQEEEMHRLREDRFAVLKRLEEAMRRHHMQRLAAQQQRPISPETARVEGPMDTSMAQEEEELWARLTHLEENNDSLQGEVSGLRRENKRLEAQLHLSSRLRRLHEQTHEPHDTQHPGGSHHDAPGSPRLQPGANDLHPCSSPTFNPPASTPSLPPPPPHPTPRHDFPNSATKHIVHNSDGVRLAFQYPPTPPHRSPAKSGGLGAKRQLPHASSPPRDAASVVPPLTFTGPAGPRAQAVNTEEPRRSHTWPHRAMEPSLPRDRVGMMSVSYNVGPHMMGDRPHGSYVGQPPPRPASPEALLPPLPRREEKGDYDQSSSAYYSHTQTSSYPHPADAPLSPQAVGSPRPWFTSTNKSTESLMGISAWADAPAHSHEQTHHHPEAHQPPVPPTWRRKAAQGDERLPPFATDESAVRLKDTAPFDQQLLVLNMERSQLQAELDKLQPKQLRTIRDRERIAVIEERLAVIGKEASRLKVTLKSIQAEA